MLNKGHKSRYYWRHTLSKPRCIRGDICVNSYKYKIIIKNQSEYDYDPIELAGTNYIILKLKIIDLTPDTCFIGQLTNKHPPFEQGDKYMLAAAISSVKLRKVSDITG